MAPGPGFGYSLREVTEFVSQPGIPGINPLCSVCIHKLEGTCDGAERPQDIFPWHNKRRPDCTNARRQVEFHTNLAQYRPEPLLDLPLVSPLPPFIPVLEAGLPVGLRLPRSELYGVGLRTLISEHGRLERTAESPSRLRRSLRLPADARLCLSCSCDDDRIEKLWERSEELGTWEALAKLRFEFVTGMTFSVWEQNPRFTQRYNIERNFASIDFFGHLGVPTVPILFCPRKADHLQAVRWLQDRPAVETVAGLAQFHRTFEDFGRFIDSFLYIRDAVGRDLRFLVIGAATLQKVDEVYRRYSRDVTIMTNKPIRIGRSGHALDEDLRASYADEDVDVLIAENDALFRRICTGLRRGVCLENLLVSESMRISNSGQLMLPGLASQIARAPAIPARLSTLDVRPSLLFG